MLNQSLAGLGGAKVATARQCAPPWLRKRLRQTPEQMAAALNLFAGKRKRQVSTNGDN